MLWPNEAACEAFAQSFANALCAGTESINASIELHGQLGAGKTSLVRHLLRALGVEGRIKSPSYAVMESYDVSSTAPRVGEVSHFDFYRFNDPREWEDAGFRDIFAAPGLKLSEWPEKASGVLPPADLQIWLDVGANDSRSVRLIAGSAWGQQMLQALRTSP
ncbi:tRNA (adenosine(37)-N6)-threonylcarbamoyltransferase complex ATPase subunit type 1 TsaE [Paucibacter sp. TC2R-5]|uniref:tRNA (adenosine(37)-N6)-threonylcarbamoyltransferase complex ATPase subunit type 1 TsaE n=1 Tax=Paucibacter sp. TC2R-5 TaxID=2893555 RepID=UPI0021E39B5D|nr:tRNA (adenosine(37)-N6)-threonylcarbamoyltransferase complex ATPase subunit type 1 TsaE [Paucibacter sp. TC2R-5]MCV2360930.1 tRNA (adenosine(37)-N6)-threonylcarbamoyltransferase complex ATPase subunit type 1 TsaE [Paucibacter sp. TC2R-5]